MNKEHLVMNANPIVVALEKPSAEFTKADIIDYIVKNDIRMVNFMYPGGDGKLKTLNFVINDLAYLDTILTAAACSRLSRQVRATFMYCPASVQLLWILSQRFLPFRCSVRSSIKTAFRWNHLPSTRSTRLLRHSAR